MLTQSGDAKSKLLSTHMVRRGEPFPDRVCITSQHSRYDIVHSLKLLDHDGASILNKNVVNESRLVKEDGIENRKAHAV